MYNCSSMKFKTSTPIDPGSVSTLLIIVFSLCSEASSDSRACLFIIEKVKQLNLTVSSMPCLSPVSMISNKRLSLQM